MAREVEVERICSLSPMQEGMLFHSILDQGSSAYFEQFVFSIDGKLELDLIEKTFNILIQRYDVLRTNFVYEKIQKPKQVVFKERIAKIHFEDLSSFNENEKALAIQEFLEKDRARFFDLGKDLLIRVSVLQTGTDLYRFVWSFHHIIMDGWCIGLVIKDFLLIYRALKDNQPVNLKPAIPYINFIKWLEKQDKGQAALYWKEYLAGYEKTAALFHRGTDSAKDAQAQYLLGEYEFSLDEGLTEALEKMAKQSAVTLSTLIQSIWGLLLQRYNNTNDVVFGAVISGRPYEIKGIEEMVGLFINTIPVRVKTEPGQGFTDLMIQIQKQVLASNRYDYFPLAEIQSYTPLKQNLIDNIIAFENFPVEKELTQSNRGIGLDFSIRDVVYVEQINYDFGLRVFPGNPITVKIGYNARYYSQDQIERIAGHFKTIIDSVLKDPEAPLEKIELLTAEELSQLVMEFNDSDVDFGKPKTIHELFETQVERAPGNIAVIFADQQLTYGELNQKANQLAHCLREKGVGPNSIVGIMVDSSLEKVIGVLGVLKSGGAYLPLDPEYPAERTAYILRDSGAVALLVQEQFKNRVEFDGSTIILNPTEQEPYSSTNPQRITGASDPAYIIYTSGTTGVPKGVIVEHRSISNTIGWRKAEYGLDETDCVLQLFSYTFDGFLTSFFTPIVSGSRTLFLKDPRDPLALKNGIVAHGVTHFIAVPPLYQSILQYLTEEETRTLKHITLAGDKTTPNVIVDSQRKNQDIELVNEYGPTENSVATTVFRNMQPGKISIGKPIANTKVLILDNQQRIQPVGISGELCIYGTGLARGYLNRPELTAEKFVPNPFVGGSDVVETFHETSLPRIYKTGDLARWAPDGNIEYLGRIDHQVKIRGFRIELGEIEEKLLESQSIKEAVVTAKDDGKGNTYLCAYYTAEWEPKASELKGHLAQSLPDYMIPSYFTLLEKMPLTPTGKLDRNALPDPEIGVNSGMAYEAPTSETETKLVKVWQELLEADRIGVNDNFFELGGHSLKATLLISRIHKEFNVAIPLKELFNRPTIKEMAKYIKGSAGSVFEGIGNTPKQEYYPLSAAQKRLYILNEFRGIGASYNMSIAYDLKGEINIQRLESVLTQIIKRQASLRTSFTIMNEEPVQKVHDQVEFHIDYQETDEASIPERMRGFHQPFNLAKAPLFRAVVFKIGNARHIMALELHHIIADGVSIGILAHDFMRLYHGEELPELKIQYQDYAVWQNAITHEQKLRKQEEYWMRRFSGEIPALNLPTDYPRPSIQSFAGATFRFEIGEDLTEGLKKLGAGTGATLYMMLLAAYNILLAKYSGQEDIIIGSPIAGRAHVDLEPIIGIFINTLALRNYPAPHKTFRGFLQEVKDNVLADFENQEYQFEDLLEKLNISRDLSRNPLFDTMFILQNMNIGTIAIPGLAMTEYKFANETSKFDLTFSAAEMAGRVQFDIEYAVKLFSPATIQKMALHYLNILKAVVANPGAALTEFEILSDQERTEILSRFNTTEMEYPRSKTIDQLLEEQVARTPGLTALVFGNRECSYAELNKKANQLARALRQKGIKNGSIVGIMVERSPEMIIGIWGILKAGGAYLPIDPEYPEDRIRYMLEDSQAPALVTQSSLAGRVQVQGASFLIDDPQIYHPDDSNLERLHEATDLAYVIYTSGSTGKPKGVMIEHRAVHNFIIGMGQKIEFRTGKTILALTTISFDIFALETLLPFSKGLRVVLASVAEQKDPTQLFALIKAHQIEILQLTPSRMKLMIDADPELSALDSVTEIIIGGEALPSELFKTLGRFAHKTIYNVYGPTETTVWSTVKDLTGAAGITIGNPIANTQVYILNKEHQIQPVGIAGELFISGDGVARGYLNRPELTAEKFVERAFRESPPVEGLPPVEGQPQRIYRTGDLVKWLPDGDIEFLGRMDHQVKIRGYRIELGEIESQLLNHEKITEAVVIARKNQTGDHYLCAYLVSNAELTVQELRERLGKTIPEYMIPAYFIQLDKIPLTPNGKIDRNKLPEPDASLSSGQEYAAPTNEIESKLLQVWQELLVHDRIGILDNFFVLGGDSLKAIRLVNRIHQLFDIQISINDVFQNSTIQELGSLLTKTNQSIYASIPPAGEQEWYPVTLAQRRLFFLERLEAGSTAYNMPLLLKIEGVLDPERLELTFKKLMIRHEALRTWFDLVDDEPAQRIAPELDFHVQFMEGMDQDINRLVAEFIRPFALNRPPLLRVGLIKQAENLHFLICDTHHIISDGVSMGIFSQEFIRLYNGDQLPPLRIQYKDYAAWQNQLLFGESHAEAWQYKLLSDVTQNESIQMKNQEKYWLERLAGKIPVLDLPTDFPRPSILSFEGGHINFQAGSKIVAGLQQIARETGATMYMLLLAAYNILLARYSGQEDIIIGLPIAGRPHADLENIIGMFVNTLVIRSYPEGEKTFAEFLKEVREDALRVYQNQDYPLEGLLDKLDLTRDSGRNPLFDVLFVSFKTDLLEMEIPGLKFIPSPGQNKTAKFDLTLQVDEREERIEFGFEYRTCLFARKTVERMASDFIKIIEAVAENAQMRIDEIQLSEKIRIREKAIKDEVMFDF